MIKTGVGGVKVKMEGLWLWRVEPRPFPSSLRVRWPTGAYVPVHVLEVLLQYYRRWRRQSPRHTLAYQTCDLRRGPD